MALGPVRPNVRAVAEYLGSKYDIGTMYGVALRDSVSDHPTGLAVDFMVGYGTSQSVQKGNALVADARSNAGPMTIKYIIWRQHIWNFSATGAPESDHDMENRGSITANHMDHVHISFYPGTAQLTGVGTPTSDATSDSGGMGSLLALAKSCAGLSLLMMAGTITGVLELLFHR